MPMIKCPECGKEISDLADKCPNCGFPIGFRNSNPINNNPQNAPINNPYPQQLNAQPLQPHNQKKGNSTLGVLALVFSILGCTFIVGIILAIIDLCRKDGRKKVCSIVALCISGLWLIIVFAGSASEDSSEKADNTQPTVMETQQELEAKDSSEEHTSIATEETEESSEETESSSESDNYLSVGSSFEKNGLKITINEANTDFQDYDNEYGWNTPKEGMKYVMVSFTYENNGDSDAYASIYDFKCYADNTDCEQVYTLDDNDFMNTNLSNGRNVSFKTYYAVPINAQSIELEYETNIWTDEKVVIKVQ